MDSRRLHLLGLATFAVLLNVSRLAGDDWPQWRGPRRDGVWRETGIVARLPEQLKIRWRASVGPGYSSPSVAAGRVYITDRKLPQGVANPDDPFQKQKLSGGERILCLDARTGKELWKHEYSAVYEIQYPSGPRAAPTVAEGRVHALGAMGKLLCLEAVSGKVVWERDLLGEFGGQINTWGYSSAPLIDGNRLVVLAAGQRGAGVVALDRETGKEIWRSLEIEDPGYSSPEIIEAGGKRQLIVWTPRALHSLDPSTGALFWSEAFELNFGLSVASPVHDPSSGLLLVSSFYNGSLAVKLAADRPAGSVLWRGKSKSERETDGLHAILCTPLFKDGHLYGICSYGQLRCLEASTGNRLWETREATGDGRWWNAYLVRHGDRVILANEQGELIFSELSPAGYRQLSRARLITPDHPIQRRKVVWAHPAFADRAVFARSDSELVCADLAAE